ncbi:MAG: ATP-binding protein, partial [Actinomycetota bacterium]
MVPTGLDDAPLIRARELTKLFAPHVAVDAIDFEVRRGEVFGFLGPNGAGKTSTMRMIGCTSPRSGGTLVSSRYERSSLIVSSNKTFSAWTEIFGDAVAVAAMVDRLVHHAEVI